MKGENVVEFSALSRRARPGRFSTFSRKMGYENYLVLPGFMAEPGKGRKRERRYFPTKKKWPEIFFRALCLKEEKVPLGGGEKRRHTLTNDPV